MNGWNVVETWRRTTKLKRLAVKSKNLNFRRRKRLSWDLPGLLGYFHLIPKLPPFSIIPCFFFHSVLECSSSWWSLNLICLLVLSQTQSPTISSLQSVLKAVAQAFSLPWPPVTASQLLSTFLPSVHANPSYMLWRDSYFWGIALMMQFSSFKSFMVICYQTAQEREQAKGSNWSELEGFVTFGKCLNLSEPPIPHLKNGNALVSVNNRDKSLWSAYCKVLHMIIDQ